MFKIIDTKPMMNNRPRILTIIFLVWEWFCCQHWYTNNIIQTNCNQLKITKQIKLYWVNNKPIIINSMTNNSKVRVRFFILFFGFYGVDYNFCNPSEEFYCTDYSIEVKHIVKEN